MAEDAKQVEKEINKLCVGKTEEQADKLLEKYYNTQRTTFRAKFLLAAPAIGASVGAVAGGITGGPIGAANWVGVGAVGGLWVGMIAYITVTNRICDKIMDLKIEINRKRRLLEKMLRDINDDIDDAKKKKYDTAKLEQCKKKIRKNLDRLDSIEASKVINRKDSNA